MPQFMFDRHRATASAGDAHCPLPSIEHAMGAVMTSTIEREDQARRLYDGLIRILSAQKITFSNGHICGWKMIFRPASSQAVEMKLTPASLMGSCRRKPKIANQGHATSQNA